MGRDLTGGTPLGLERSTGLIDGDGAWGALIDDDVGSRVVVQFVINREGNVTNPIVLRGIGGGCDEEALRVIMLAKFRPGMQRGKPVPVKYTIPILFKMAKD